MSRDVFKQVREAVTAEQAARFYGLDIQHHRAKCFIHGGTHYNLSFRGGGFKCFICGEGGDSIEFVRQLQRLATPLDVLKRLNEDFSLGVYVDREQFTDEQKREYAQQRAAKQRAEVDAQKAFVRWLTSARDWLSEYWKARYPGLDPVNASGNWEAFEYAYISLQSCKTVQGYASWAKTFRPYIDRARAAIHDTDSGSTERSDLL
jgi:hypothetical protein